MKKSMLSFAALAASLGFASCDTAMEGNLLPPPDGEVVNVSFAPSVSNSERTRSGDPLSIANPFDAEKMKLEYAIYETDGTIVTQNSIVKACTGTMSDLNFSEPLRRNHDYKVAVWVTKLPADESPIYTFDAANGSVRYTDAIANPSSVNVDQINPKYADAFLYSGTFKVDDGFGAAIAHPIILTRPFTNVVLLTDEQYSNEKVSASLSASSISRSATRGAADKASQFPIGYNFWDNTVSYSDFNGGDISNVLSGSNSSANKVTYNTRPNMAVLGNFFLFTPKAEAASSDLHLVLSEIEADVPVGSNKLVQGARVIISNKPTTAFFTCGNNFLASINVDYDRTQDVYGTQGDDFFTFNVTNEDLIKTYDTPDFFDNTTGVMQYAIYDESGNFLFEKSSSFAVSGERLNMQVKEKLAPGNYKIAMMVMGEGGDYALHAQEHTIEMLSITRTDHPTVSPEKGDCLFYYGDFAVGDENFSTGITLTRPVVNVVGFKNSANRPAPIYNKKTTVDGVRGFYSKWDFLNNSFTGWFPMNIRFNIRSNLFTNPAITMNSAELFAVAWLWPIVTNGNIDVFIDSAYFAGDSLPFDSTNRQYYRIFNYTGGSN